MLIKRFKQWLQTLTIVLLFAVLPLQVLSLPKCSQYSKNWNNCYGIVKADGISYRGEFKNNDYHGVGRMEINDADGRWFYYGEWAGGEQNGEGIEVHESLGLIMEGIFVNNSLIKPQKTRFSKDVSFLKIK